MGIISSNMPDADVIEWLDTTVDRLLAKYDPSSLEDMENIAREEYGAVVVQTPLIGLCSKARKTSTGIYIFYHTRTAIYRSLALGHEIGHIAANHFDRPELKFIPRELEADHFSARLNGVSLLDSYLYCFIDASLVLTDLFPFGKAQEIKRLQELGVYELLPKYF